MEQFRVIAVVCLSFQLLYGNIVRKNHPTQFIGFLVDLTVNCVEGMQMNWANYLVNELEKDCCEAWDLGYEFNYSWLIILVTFVAWKMPEESTFPKIKPTEPLVAQFSTLWYTNDMMKQ
jgi:hypothetical protein